MPWGRRSERAPTPPPPGPGLRSVAAGRRRRPDGTRRAVLPVEFRQPPVRRHGSGSSLLPFQADGRPGAKRPFQMVERTIDGRVVPAVLDHATGIANGGAVAAEAGCDLAQRDAAG